ncbi:hypothetical protein [Magnetovibrio blakemorei]|uniref:Uncharacterized protein n=1 Tax=Magnetovibrio blakemorei TaxID=28181 RepID=A0A1E5Q4B7_9PROT|nr:hypothetical protein [Magnetovibrio blakemorei]OEJ64624.1 hypothetical protein BEN30_00580 [Magnetovibrio blakemorei]
MSEEHTDDYKKMMNQKRFLNDIEQGIRIANREIIHKRIPALNKDTVLAFAVAIARARTRYLEAAFRAAATDKGEPLDQGEVNQLRSHRESYEETKKAFEALRYAIEQGYVDVEMVD